MKRRLLLFIALMLVVFTAMCFCACSKDRGNVPSAPRDPNIEDTGDDDDDGDDDSGEGNRTDRVVFLKVTNSRDIVRNMPKQSSADAQPEVYSIKVTLAVDDRVTVYDNKSHTYQNYSGTTFNGTVMVAGEHTFELRITPTAYTLNVTLPTPIQPPPTPIPTPQNTEITVSYTNSNRWSKVYAYLWNSVTTAKKKVWPGEQLSATGTSGFGEKQYSIKVDYSVYDRVIFNDGGDNQTNDLVVGRATSGYYGTDGIFTMDTSDTAYGSVYYTTLTDTKNLSYINRKLNDNYKGVATKKISVYTPHGYTPTKKYGVLYMFDGQNLYAGATGAEVADNPWAADVAVTSLMKNGGDGVIIVAIDNTDGYRDMELTMSPSFGNVTSLAYNNDFRNGKLEMLGDFIKETVMPWVKDRYSVDTSREKAGIAGASSGGLAAYYLGLRDNDLYGYIGAFSPANGLFTSSDWNKFYASKNFGSGNRPNLYVYCGETGDEKDLLPATKQIKPALTSAVNGFTSAQIIENYVEKGTHSETFWRVAFTEFLGKLAK